MRELKIKMVELESAFESDMDMFTFYLDTFKEENNR